MYKRILVAVDGSDSSYRALQEALQLAREQGALVRVVHAVDVRPPATPEVYVDFETYRQSCLQGGREVLDRAVAIAREVGVDVDATLIETQTPQFSDAILDEARRWSADLIVLGTHGRGGLLHLLLGSVAEGVVRRAPVPVLLVRDARTGR